MQTLLHLPIPTVSSSTGLNRGVLYAVKVVFIGAAALGFCLRRSRTRGSKRDANRKNRPCLQENLLGPWSRWSMSMEWGHHCATFH